MYENPKFNQNNEKILCERNGKNSDMLMDIRVNSQSGRNNDLLRSGK